MTLPVLLLKASSAYTMQALGYLADGGAILSNTSGVSTDALPALVPHYSVAPGGHPNGTLTLVGQNAAASWEESAVVKPPYVDAFSTATVTNYVAVVDENGQPVWYLTLPEGMGLCGDVQKQPDDTYTAALYDPAHGPFPVVDAPAKFYQYDNLGNLLHVWVSPDCWATNEHDMRLLPDGTALLLGIEFHYMDTWALPGGPPHVTCDTNADCVPSTANGLNGQGAAENPWVCNNGNCDATVYSDKLEQIAPDGGLLWSWDEFNVLPFTDLTGESYSTSVIDETHSNSIEILNDGNYLVNMRDMSQAVKVSSTDGGILWILGGVQSSFRFVGDPYKNGPSYQHGTRQLSNGDIIMFDNGCGRPYPYADRGVEYALDEDAGTATMVWQYQPTCSSLGFTCPAQQQDHLEAIVFGLSQRLDGGNTLVTFGDTRHVVEVDADGGVVWQMVDDQPVIYPDGGTIYYPDGGANTWIRDWGIYQSWRLDTVY